MRFEQLKHRVARREQLLDGRLQQTRDHWQSLTSTWRASWTPVRIVVAGLLGGFLTGRSDPAHTIGKLRALGGSGSSLIQLIGTLSGFFATMQAATAAQQAEHAVDKADEVAKDARPPQDGAALRAEAAAPAPESAVAPRPAEAATELSER